MDALATYVSFLTPDGGLTGYSFHNFHAGQVRDYDNTKFMYAGFGYTGGIVSLDAANADAALVFLITDLMVSLAMQAQKSGWLVSIMTVWLDPETLDETSDRLEEVYSVTSWKTNLTELVVSLGSPLDARDAEIPARVLSRRLVGSLPPSGVIAFI